GAARYRVQDVGRGARHRRESKGIPDADTGVGLFLHLPARHLGVGVGGHPGAAPNRESAALVVFGGGTPEGGPRRTPNPLIAVGGAQGGQAALGIGELQLKPVAPDAQVHVALGDGQGTADPQGRQGAGGRPAGVFGVVGGAVGRRVVPVAGFLHGRLFGAVSKDDAVAAEGVVGGTLPEVA